jgi:NAD(P)-dependent dehydrogenase (short-subunit alcohol dehydrogenase family)
MNRTILITGGTKGIGEALVRSAASKGYKVIFTGRSEKRGQDLASELNDAERNVLFCPQDVSSVHDWHRICQILDGEGGTLHALVNNAGVHTMKTLDQYTREDFQHMVDINLRGVFLGTQACLPYLAKAGTPEKPSSLVTISSVAGLVGGVGQSLYNMTKGGVELFSRSIALEAAALGYQVKVNTVCPGIVETDMGHDLIRQFAETGLVSSPEHADRALRRGYANGQFPSISDVVGTVMFLIDADSPFLTGASIPVDRGYTTG